MWHLRTRQKRSSPGSLTVIDNQEMSKKVMETLNYPQNRDLVMWDMHMEKAAASQDQTLDHMTLRLWRSKHPRTQDADEHSTHDKCLYGGAGCCDGGLPVKT